MKRFISILVIFSTLCSTAMSCSFAAEEVTQEAVITKQEPAVAKQEKKDKTMQNVILGSLVAAYAGLGVYTINTVGSLAYEQGYAIGRTKTWYNKIWNNPIVSVIRYYAINWAFNKILSKIMGYFCPGVSPLTALLQLLGNTPAERVQNLGLNIGDNNVVTVPAEQP